MPFDETVSFLFIFFLHKTELPVKGSAPLTMWARADFSRKLALGW